MDQPTTSAWSSFRSWIANIPFWVWIVIGIVVLAIIALITFMIWRHHRHHRHNHYINQTCPCAAKSPPIPASAPSNPVDMTPEQTEETAAALRGYTLMKQGYASGPGYGLRDLGSTLYGNNEALAQSCTMDEKCVGFQTSGWLLTGVNPTTFFDGTTSDANWGKPGWGVYRKDVML